MKRAFLSIISALFLTLISFGQAPDAFKYQAVVRDASGVIVTNQSVGFRVVIQQGSIGGTAVYTETFTPTTNDYGLINLEIGTGTTSDNFSMIDWSAGPYFVESAIDVTGGTSYSVMGTSELLSVPYALHARTADSLAGGNRYEIGDFAQGGIVFWVDETGEHGLVCAIEDQSTGVRWNAGTNGFTRVEYGGIYGGEMNTAIILAAHLFIGDDGGAYAARLCNDMEVVQNGITYGDWYLPTVEELQAIFANKAIINTTATSNGGGVFADEFYFSSQESAQNFAKGIFMNNGVEFISGKTGLHHVRAVRAF